MHVSTTAVHAGRAGLERLGVHALPLDLSTTNPLAEFDDPVGAIDALIDGGGPVQGPASGIYARLHNPTVARFEAAVAALEGAEAAVAFATGMAALTACMLSLDGSHVVGVRPLYGGTDHLLSSGLLPVDVTWAEAKQAGDAVTTDTAAVVVETPANPTLAMVDLGALVRAVAPVPVLVDNTVATPVRQHPLRHGAAWSVHSATKAIGGHGDALGGVVATDPSRAARLRQVRIATGAVLDPFAAYLLHRGLPTLPVRVDAAERTATELARRLAEDPRVEVVHHPSRPGADPEGLLGRQLLGPGSLLAFEPTGGLRAAEHLLRTLRLITPAVSLGTTDTLIQRPAGLTHRVVGAEARAEGGITDALLRLSVGLEDASDLWADLDAALGGGR